MYFNISRFDDERGTRVYFEDYIETIEAPDAETAILQFAVHEFGPQNAFKPERWSHISGSDIIGHRYDGFYQATVSAACKHCSAISCKKNNAV